MNAQQAQTLEDHMQAAYTEGRRSGLAISALAVAAVSFITLLGMEKVLLALVLAVVALRGAKKTTSARKLAILAIVVAAVYELTWWTIIALYHDKLMEIIHIMQRLG